MKKLWVLVAAVAMMLCMVSVSLAADNLVDERKSQVDIVVVMDMSNSMTKSDSANNRNVAAQLITSLMDMNGSRIAFVTFNYDKMYASSTFQKLESIGDVNRALGIIINQVTNDQLKPNTDFGAGLAWAYNLLAERDEASKESNQPMIVLLTDGKNDFTSPESGYDGVFYEYRSSDGLFHANTSSRRSKKTQKDADALVDEVVQHAAENNIRIYTIALSTDNTFIEQLRQIATRTGADSLSVDPKSANRLPEFFSRIFAAQIGSTEARSLDLQIDGSDYYVNIPILNRSVVEANIYVPAQSLDTTQPVMRDPNGVDRTHDTNYVVTIDSKSPNRQNQNGFHLYKIRSNNEASFPYGIWTLHFKLAKNANPSQIKLSLLYNYNIQLRTSIGGTLVNAQDALRMSKGSVVDIKAQFYDLETSQASTDQYLYMPQASDEDTIKVHYALLDAQMQPVRGAEGQLDMHTEQCEFAGQLDLMPFDLRQGTYYLTLTANGAGLERENRIQLELTNTDPLMVAGDTMSVDMEVEIADKPETSVEQTRTIDLGQCFQDPDQDQLTYQLAGGSNDPVVGVELDEAQQQLRISTKKDGAHFRYGSEQYTLTAMDDDGGASTLTLNIEVMSGYAVSQNYVYDVTGITDQTAYPKAHDIRVEVTASDQGEPRQLSLLTGEMVVTDYDHPDLASKLSVPLALERDGWVMAGVYTTSNYKSSKIEVTINILYQGEVINTRTYTINVENHPPVLATDYESHLPTTMTYAALPGFLSTIEQPTSDADRVIRLDDLFSDPDQETLTYTLRDAENECFQADVQNRNELLMTLLTGGTHTFTIVATDNDGETAEVAVPFKVVNLRTRYIIIGLLLLALLVVLILLLLAIHHAMLPKFSPKGSLKISQRNALYGTNYDFSRISKPKKPLQLSSIIIVDTCQAIKINHNELQQVEIYPTRSPQRLKITLKKDISSVIIQLGGDTQKILTKRKPLILEAGAGTSRELNLISTSNHNDVLCISYQMSTPSSINQRTSASGGAPSPFGGSFASGGAPSPFRSTPSSGSAPSPFRSTPASGGAANPFGGTPASGGAASPFGGTPASGGAASPFGGTPASGGAANPFGGTPASGGAANPFGGTPASGGAANPFGGTPASGGAANPFGGTPASGGDPSNPFGTPKP